MLLFPDALQSEITGQHHLSGWFAPEGYGETGMAHLLEHMLFKSTPIRSLAGYAS